MNTPLADTADQNLVTICEPESTSRPTQHAQHIAAVQADTWVSCASGDPRPSCNARHRRSARLDQSRRSEGPSDPAPHWALRRNRRNGQPNRTGTVLPTLRRWRRVASSMPRNLAALQQIDVIGMRTNRDIAHAELREAVQGLPT